MLKKTEQGKYIRLRDIVLRVLNQAPIFICTIIFLHFFASYGIKVVFIAETDALE